MYKLNSSDFNILLCYKDFYGSDEGKPDIMEVIPRLNMHKAISIICELIAYRNKKIDFRVFNSLISVPLELGLKIKLLNLNQEQLRMDRRCKRHTHILSLQMLLNLLKYVISYGNFSTLNQTDYEITFDDYKTIIDLQMVVTESYDHFYEDMTDDEKAYFIYANYHINYDRCVANSIIRNYYMFEKLAVSADNFDDAKNEWRDYPSEFLSKYNFSISDYMAVMFYELITYYNDEKSLFYSSFWRSIDNIYGNTNIYKLSKNIIESLSASPSEINEWAITKLEAPWDFSFFYTKPFIKCNNEHIAVSDLTSRNCFSDNIYWLIRGCYPKDDSRCMAFYGRLHEKYVQDLTYNATKNNPYVKCISEFICNSGNKSSDAYIQIDDNLIIIECKGFSVLFDTITKGQRINANNAKLFIDPVLQADERFAEIVNVDKKFTDIKQTYIISVTMDNVNAVPQYYEAIYKEIDIKKKSPLTKYVYNLNIEEYERLMYYVENNADIISILKEYYDTEKLLPFTSYLSKRYNDAFDAKTTFMERIYSELSNKLREKF